MRDVLMFVLVFGGIPFMVRWPYVGVLYWVWIGLMNPHRLAWGPAFDFPFALVTVIATFVGLLFTADERRWKAGSEVYLLLAFVAWMGVTTIFALNPEDAVPMLIRVLKIQLMVFVSLLVFHSKRHIDLMVWVLALSVGFYGIKGGLFTLVNGGGFRVWGPADSFIEDNNALALAVIMVIPLFVYLAAQTHRIWLKVTLGLIIVFCALSSLGSYSRGALLAIAAMAAFLWTKSQRKAVSGMVLLILVPILLIFMPDAWKERMWSIRNYQQDDSAMGRLDAWGVLSRIAGDRFTGGGFEPYTEQIYAQYQSTAPDVHSAHSIYFQVLGEHGWVGFLLFLSVWAFAWRCAWQVRRGARGDPDLAWVVALTAMIQVGLIGYFVGGAFLNLAYWDLPYYFIVLLVVMRDYVRRAAASQPQRVTGMDGITQIVPMPVPLPMQRSDGLATPGKG